MPIKIVENSKNWLKEKELWFVKHPKYKELKEEIEDLKRQLTDRDGEIANLRNGVELKSQRDRANGLAERLENNRKNISNLQKENGILKLARGELDDENHRLKAENERLGRENSLLKFENSTLGKGKKDSGYAEDDDRSTNSYFSERAAKGKEYNTHSLKRERERERESNNSNSRPTISNSPNQAKQIEDLEQQKRELEEKNSKLAEDLADANTLLSANGRQFLLDEIDALQKGKIRDNEEIDILKHNSLLKDGEIGLLENQKQILTTELNNALFEIEQLKNHSCSMGENSSEVADLRRQLAEAEQQRDKVEKDLKTALEARDRIQEESDNQDIRTEEDRRQIAFLTNKKNELENDLANAQSGLSAKEKENEDLITNLAAETRAKNEAQTKLNDTQTNLENTLKSLHNLQTENKELVQRPPLDEYNKLKNTLAEAQEDLILADNSIDNLLTKQTELQNQLNAEQNRNENLQNECQKLRQAKETLTQQTTEQQTEIDLNRKLTADLHQQNDQLLDNYSQEKITHDLAKTQLINTKRSLYDLQEENRQFQSDIYRIIAERDARPDITQTEYNDLVQKSQKLEVEQKKVELLQNKTRSLRGELATEKTAHSQTQIQLTNEQNRNANLQTSLLNEQTSHGATRIERDNFLNQLTNANLKLATYENYLKNELKIVDLTNLPTLPAEQSLTDLIIFFNLHSQHDCCNPLHSDHDSLKTRLEQAEADRDQLATETEELKDQKTQIENDYQQQLTQQEKEIITKFITELKLVDCNENSSPEKVIEIIQQLLIKPNNNNSDTPFGESLTNIKKVDLKMFQNLGITPSKELENNIEKVDNYQELVDLRQQEIKAHLAQENNRFQAVNQEKGQLINRQKNERIIFIALLVTGAIAATFLVRKLRKIQNSNKKYRQEHQSIQQQLTELRQEMRVILSTVLKRENSPAT